MAVAKKPKKPRAKLNDDYVDDNLSLSYRGLTKEQVDSDLATKKHVGRPAYIPCERHYDLVRALCLFGADHEWIASYIGITPKTLRKYYPSLLKNCKEDKNTSAEGALFVQVMKGNTEAIKLWLSFNMPDKYGKNAGNTPAEGSNNNNEFLQAIAKVLKPNDN